MKSSFNPEWQPDPTNTAIAQFTIGIRLRAFVQHTGRLTVAGMYKNCTKEESPEIGIRTQIKQSWGKMETYTITAIDPSFPGLKTFP